MLALRIATMRPLRADAAAHPGLALALGTMMAAAAAAIAWAVAAWTEARHVASACALAAMIAAWWRARPGHGASRGWPPGSLGLRASLAAIDDRSYYRDQAERHGPVFKMSQFGRPVACVVGHERGRRLFAEHAGALAPAKLPYNRLLAKGLLRYMGRDDHRQEAPLFRAILANVDLEAAESSVRAGLRAQLDRLCADSQAIPAGVSPRDYGFRWLAGAVARLFLGVGHDDPRVERIAALLPLLHLHRAGGTAWRRRILDAMAGMTAILREVADDYAAGSPRVAPGSVIALLLAAEPDALDRPARAENMVLIERLATGDLAGLLDWIVLFLGDSPRWRDEVRRHGRTHGGAQSSLPLDPATCVAMETLRLEQSEFVYRRVVAPIAFEGHTIPAGWLLRLCVNESHRDASVHPDPHVFDPARFRDRAWSRNEYSPFGGHAHGCMGGHVALFLARVFVEELAIGYEWTVTADGPHERWSRHRDHWRPNPRRRIAMRARAGAHEDDGVEALAPAS